MKKSEEKQKTVYIFHRKDMFYPLELNDEFDAIENAKCNEGTLAVTDTDFNVIWKSKNIKFSVREEIDNILEDCFRNNIGLLELRKRLLFLINNIANNCFDSGFDISTERFNAEFRDQYDLFDEEYLNTYIELKTNIIFKNLL